MLTVGRVQIVARTVAPMFCRCLAAAQIQRTPLFENHVKRGAKMVPFAGWEMPVQYEGVLPEHKQTRESVGLFDVSHMGQLRIHGKDRVKFIESLVTADVAGLKKNQTKLSMFLNEKGGIKDDTMVCNRGDYLFVVVNAGCKEKDIAHIREHLQVAKKNGLKAELEVIDDRSLIAIQGPKSAQVVQRLVKKDLKEVAFMSSRELPIKGLTRPCLVTRCGYTGEDGFEVSVHNDDVVKFWDHLCAQPECKPIGLGARDSLRLESGLCLYSHDMNEDVNPVEASLMWLIPKSRRQPNAFVGANAVLDILKNKSDKMRRVGFVVEKGAPARDPASVFNAEGKKIGYVTSGTFGVTLGKPCGMCYVEKKYQKIGTKIQVETRGKKNPAVISKTPFVPGTFYRGGGFE